MSYIPIRVGSGNNERQKSLFPGRSATLARVGDERGQSRKPNGSMASRADIFSSAEGRRKQVDLAMEYALECAITKRPLKPLPFVAEKLRLWDDAVNGRWPLRDRAEQVFTKALKSGSAVLSVDELAALQGSESFLNVGVAPLDTTSKSAVNATDWLVYIRQLASASEDAAGAVLDVVENWINEGQKRPDD